MKRLALLIASSLLLATCAQAGSFSPKLSGHGGAEAPETFPLPSSWLASDATTGPAHSRVVAEEVHSALLGHRIRVLVYLPPGYSTANPYPTLFLLHGVPGTPDDMFQGLDLQNRLDHLIRRGSLPPTVVVVPTGGPTPSTDTEWSDSAVDPTQRWGSFLSDELVPWVDRTFSTCTDRRDRAVAGLSMGGFGAMNLALKHRDLFGTVSSWSGYFEANTPSVEGRPGSPGWVRDSPIDYVASLTPSLARNAPRMSFYVGDADRFLRTNQRFDRVLTEPGVPHRFRVLPGGHDWTLWKGQLNTELTWIGLADTCRAPLSN